MLWRGVTASLKFQKKNIKRKRMGLYHDKKKFSSRKRKNSF